MAYQTISVRRRGGIARLTLNRPDRLNSFNVEMHDEVRDALDAVAAQQSARARAGAHRRRPRLLRRPGSRRSRGRAGRAARRSRRIDRAALQAAGARAARAADAGHRGGQRCRRRRRREHRARLRSRDRDALGELHSVVRKLGLVPDSGGTWQLPRLRRHCARDGARVARRQAAAPSRPRSGA